MTLFELEESALLAKSATLPDSDPHAGLRLYEGWAALTAQLRERLVRAYAENDRLRDELRQWREDVRLLTEAAAVLESAAQSARSDLAKVREAVGEDLQAGLERLRARASAADSFAETIDGVREALGQRETHYLVVAGDVEELVRAVEEDSCGRSIAVLRKLRERA